MSRTRGVIEIEVAAAGIRATLPVRDLHLLLWILMVLLIIAIIGVQLPLVLSAAAVQDVRLPAPAAATTVFRLAVPNLYQYLHLINSCEVRF